MYKCKCCEKETLPAPPREATAYICPVCFWENDVFTSDDAEPSDENHGLSLIEGRENYKKYGICDPRLREPMGRAPADGISEKIPTADNEAILGRSERTAKLILPQKGE